MTEPIKAKCCDFGREYMAWNGGAWWVFGDFKAKACICGSELKKPLPEVVLTEEGSFGRRVSPEQRQGVIR
jgi:hypothetical protein